MKAKNIIILVCVAAALVAVAVFTSKEGTGSKKTTKPELIFKDLPVNDVTGIEIIKADKTFRVKRTDDGWVAPDKFNYPVKFDRVKQALMALIELKAGDQRDLNDKQRARIKMVSPLDKDAKVDSKGTLARIYTSGSEPAASLLIGGERKTESAAPGAGAGGTFISPDEGKSVLVTSQYIGYLKSADVTSWLNTEILSVNSYGITNVIISPCDEKPTILHDDGKGALTMDGISSKEKVDDTKARSVKYAVSYLRYTEVADPALDDKAMGFDKPSTFTAMTSDGESYTVTIGGSPEGSSDRYLRAEAKFIAEIPKDAAGEKDPAKAARKTKLEAARTKVEAANKRLRNWTYVVSASSVEPMLYTRKDLITKKKDD